MPLSMKSEIAALDIADGAELAPGRVFKLTGWENDGLAIKLESSMYVTTDQINTARRAMKQVDPVAAAAKIMTPNERRAIRAFIDQYTAYTAVLTDCRMATYAMTGGAPAWVQALGGVIGAGIWYKMPLHNVADIGDALTARMQTTPDKGLLTEFQDALTRAGGMESLGKIVACDLINGNLDRFSPVRGVTKTFGGVSFQFRSLINIGNVFIAGSGSSRSVTGLDFFESQGIFRMYERTLASIKAEFHESWPGFHLVNSDLRRQFCKKIVYDLNLILSGGNPKGRRMGHKKTWVGRDAKDRLEYGMIEGGRQVRDGLRQKYAGAPNRPAGLDDRLTALAKL